MFYMVWKTGVVYQDLGADYYQQQYQERMVKNLEKKLLAWDLNLLLNLVRTLVLMFYK